MVRAVSAVYIASLLTSTAGAQGLHLAVDRDESYIVARTYKGGFLSVFGAGHEHGVLATEWSAEACFDPEVVGASRAAVVIPTGSLRIDSPRARELAGLGPGGPSPSEVREIQQKMLGPRLLSAANHPRIRFQVAEVRRDGEGGLLVKGPLTIRGVTRNITVPVRVSARGPNAYRFEGKFQVKQTDYGMKPESVAGAVTVKDQVDVRFAIVAAPAGPCM
jgi:polyisoprenoid-binding protein YceI